MVLPFPVSVFSLKVSPEVSQEFGLLEFDRNVEQSLA
jgi:hypothetical protein